MHIVLVTHYYPPESNAPANRAYEHARVWISLGHEVTIVTAAPSHPAGRVYPGYENVFSDDMVDGIRVIRLPTSLAANRGIVARSFAFISFFVSVLRHRGRIPRSDAVISTTPQFFCGLAGWSLRRRGVPWVLEVRDLWPDSIVAVGAMRRNLAIRALELLERRAYRAADLVITTTKSHREHVLERAPGKPVTVIPNGITAGLLADDGGAGPALRRELGIEGRFVAAYFGTHGMAHRLETVLDAAAVLRADERIVFVLAGDGAAREAIEAQAAARELTNVLVLGQQPRARMAALWASADAALVLLRRSPTFEHVLPSKLIEAMSLGKPVVLGVEGEAKALLEEARSGIAIEPEDGDALAAAVTRLADDAGFARECAANGRQWALAHFDRGVLAARMIDAIEGVRP